MEIVTELFYVTYSKYWWIVFLDDQIVIKYNVDEIRPIEYLSNIYLNNWMKIFVVVKNLIVMGLI